MPMSFPDLASLTRHAKMLGFREPSEGEAEEAYRVALGDFVQPMDHVESCEIRNKVGWDQFTDEQNMNMLLWRMPSWSQPKEKP